MFDEFLEFSQFFIDPKQALMIGVVTTAALLSIGRYCSYDLNSKKKRQDDDRTEISKKNRRRDSDASEHNYQQRRCRVCRAKIFPTDKFVTAQKCDYHYKCFKCTLCGTRLKNRPDEDHMISESERHPKLYVTLKCPNCIIESEERHKSRILSTVAGEKIVVPEKEQGDVDKVVDLIGDELEDAVCGMIPRCSICGGDFLRYKGEITIMGTLKYHKECREMGKPSVALGASTALLSPLQVAKYLPDTLILRLGDSTSGKIISTLFFVWMDDKDCYLKSLRTTNDNQDDCVDISFRLDNEARANPNYKDATKNNKRCYSMLPPCEEDPTHPPILAAIVNDQIAPQNPYMVKPSSIMNSEEEQSSSPIFCVSVAYDFLNLSHLVNLKIPCTSIEANQLVLSGAELMVTISRKYEIEED